MAHQPEGPEFEELFQKYYPSIVYWFLQQGESKESAEDLAQEVFIQAFKGFDGFKGKASFKTWIFTIARNTFLNRLRDRKAKKRDGQEVSITVSPDDDRPVTEPVDPQPGVERTYLGLESKRIVLGALSGLPPKMRQVVELRLEGFKYREIATLLGSSIDTIKSHLHEGRRRLRDAAAPDPPEPPQSPRGTTP